MLILDYPEWIQPTGGKVLIPKAIYKPTPELEQVDTLLQDETFEEPIIEQFNTQRSQPTVQVRVYLRMMFLKHYTGLSYEDLEPEVTHSLGPSIRRLCFKTTPEYFWQTSPRDYTGSRILRFGQREARPIKQDNAPIG